MILRPGGFFNPFYKTFTDSEPDFTKQPKIADFASEYFCEELGESGVGSRAAVGVAVLPGEAPVEIAIIAGAGK